MYFEGKRGQYFPLGPLLAIIGVLSAVFDHYHHHRYTGDEYSA